MKEIDNKKRKEKKTSSLEILKWEEKKKLDVELIKNSFDFSHHHRDNRLTTTT